MSNYGLLQLLIEQKMLIERLRLVNPIKAEEAERSLNNIINSELENKVYFYVAKRIVDEVNKKYFSGLANSEKQNSYPNSNHEEIKISYKGKVFIDELTNMLGEINSQNFLDYMKIVNDSEATFNKGIDGFNLYEDIQIYSLICMIKYKIFILGAKDNHDTYDFNQSPTQFLYGFFCDINSILNDNYYPQEMLDKIRSIINRSVILQESQNVDQLIKCALAISDVINGKQISEVSDKRLTGPDSKVITNEGNKNRPILGKPQKIKYDSSISRYGYISQYDAADFKVDDKIFRIFYPTDKDEYYRRRAGTSAPVFFVKEKMANRKSLRYLSSFVERVNSSNFAGESIAIDMYGLKFEVFYDCSMSKIDGYLKLSKINEDTTKKERTYYVECFSVLEDPEYPREINDIYSKPINISAMVIDDSADILNVRYIGNQGKISEELIFSSKNGHALVTNHFIDRLGHYITVEVEKSIIIDGAHSRTYRNVVSVYIDGNLCSVELKESTKFDDYSIYDAENIVSSNYNVNECLNPYVFMMDGLSLEDLDGPKYKNRIIVKDDNKSFYDNSTGEEYFYIEKSSYEPFVTERLRLSNNNILEIHYNKYVEWTKRYYVNGKEISQEGFWEFRYYKTNVLGDESPKALMQATNEEKTANRTN